MSDLTSMEPEELALSVEDEAALEARCELLGDIAKQHLGIETLEPRNRDSIDFHDVSVWGVQAALTAAYLAGKNSAKGH